MTSPDRAGFLSRWSRRKSEAREGVLPAQDEEKVPDAAEIAASGTFVTDAPSDLVVEASEHEDSPPDENPPVLTLQDVDALTPDADFSRFVKVDVSPEVKNAALRKLFSDPHYNVMDRLDIYIDDYSNLEVLPAPMLKDMVSAHALKMFDRAPEDSEVLSAADVGTPDVGPNDQDAQAELVLTESERIVDPLTGVDQQPLDSDDPPDPASSTTLR